MTDLNARKRKLFDFMLKLKKSVSSVNTHNIIAAFY